MKAALYSRYGSPDVVQIKHVEKPVPKDNEILIKVRAASVNPLDRGWVRGTPYLVRLMGGIGTPKDTRLGVDLAGQVEAAGRTVTHFKPGDEVFGMARGAFAEYVCAPESASRFSAVAVKPGNLTFEQAAAVPVAGFTALQGLRDKGKIQAGRKVLINGAAGGVGTFAVQIARLSGAEVTGICSTRNVNMVRSLGADCVIDYTQEDFTKGSRRYDIVLDCVGNHSLSVLRRVMDPSGIVILVGGPSGPWISPVDRFQKALVLSRFVDQNFVPFIAKGSKEDLAVLCELIEAGKVTPVVDRCYRLSEVPAAIRYLGEGHARGKVVISVE